MLRLLLALFLSSSAAVLFSLSVFRLLSFFIMPSMFFALLLVGFPIGAALATRRPQADVPRFRRVLGVLQIVMGLSILITLTAKHADHMRASLLFGVQPERLLAQVVTFALFYLPFFIAYGAAEYVGYLTGTQAFGQRMRPVYGVFLFGGAAAFGAAALLQQPLGVPRLLMLAIALVSLSKLLLSSSRRGRAVCETALLALVLCWPGFDPAFMRAFRSPASVRDSVASLLADNPNGRAHSAWGKYGYVDIVELPRKESTLYTGYYNDIAMWLYQGGGKMPEGERLEPRDRVPELFLPAGGSVAILGSGGGREVAVARRAGAGRILALEIEPRVVHMIQNELHRGFDDVYDDHQPTVAVYVGEARRYFERTCERFDLILMISVGGYPQLMLEPGNMIRTIDAFRVFVDHLSPRGVLAVGYSAALDKEGILLNQYYHTLRLLGLETYAYARPDGQAFLLLAFPADAAAEQKALWDQGRRRLEAGAVPRLPSETAMPHFRPITDDRPFLSGNIREILSEPQIWWMFLVLSGVVGVVGSVVTMAFQSWLARRHCPVPTAAFLGMGFLVGANFMLLEHLCVIHLFRHLYAYYDALVLGIIAFLMLTGAGSLLVPRRWLSLMVLGSLALAGAWWVGMAGGGIPAVALLVPAILATGTFFPVLFEQVPQGRLALFGMDALGTAAGALLAFFIPMLLGFQTLTAVAMSTTAATGLAMLAFFHWAGFRSSKG